MRDLPQVKCGKWVELFSALRRVKGDMIAQHNAAIIQLFLFIILF